MSFNPNAQAGETNPYSPGSCNFIIPHGSTYETTQTANQLYYAMVTIPVPCVVTGIQVDNGGTVAGNVLVGLFNAAGSRVAVSASTAMSGTYYFQCYPFTGTYLAAPGDYYLGVIPSSSTATWINCHNGSPAANTGAGSFAMPSSLTPPAATARAGYTPIMGVY